MNRLPLVPTPLLPRPDPPVGEGGASYSPQLSGRQQLEARFIEAMLLTPSQYHVQEPKSLYFRAARLTNYIIGEPPAS